MVFNVQKLRQRSPFYWGNVNAHNPRSVLYSFKSNPFISSAFGIHLFTFIPPTILQSTYNITINPSTVYINHTSKSSLQLCISIQSDQQILNNMRSFEWIFFDECIKRNFKEFLYHYCMTKVFISELYDYKSSFHHLFDK